MIGQDTGAGIQLDDGPHFPGETVEVSPGLGMMLVQSNKAVLVDEVQTATPDMTHRDPAVRKRKT